MRPRRGLSPRRHALSPEPHGERPRSRSRRTATRYRPARRHARTVRVPGSVRALRRGTQRACRFRAPSLAHRGGPCRREDGCVGGRPSRRPRIRGRSRARLLARPCIDARGAALRLRPHRGRLRRAAARGPRRVHPCRARRHRSARHPRAPRPPRARDLHLPLVFGQRRGLEPPARARVPRLGQRVHARDQARARLRAPTAGRRTALGDGCARMARCSLLAEIRSTSTQTLAPALAETSVRLLRL